jgi:hypothetical protein
MKRGETDVTFYKTTDDKCSCCNHHCPYEKTCKWYEEGSSAMECQYYDITYQCDHPNLEEGNYPERDILYPNGSSLIAVPCLDKALEDKTLTIVVGKTKLVFEESGEIYHNDKLIETDAELVKAFRELVSHV